MLDKSSQKGFVYLIGAGPGDPGLITVKGQDCIAKSNVILYDYLANEHLLAHAAPDAELIYAGKIGGIHNHEQWQINDLLVKKALQGKVVSRLKGGDPFVFGRGGEECEALVANDIPFEIIPGVTAGIGASAYAGIPLTHRNCTTSVTFVTGHEGHGKKTSGINWEALSLGTGTIVFYMGIKNLASIAENLITHGRDPETPVALIRWGTRPNQEVLIGVLSNIAAKAHKINFKAPAITVVGEVVNLRDKLRWFDSRSLFGKGILVTRAAEQASTFAEILNSHGASVYECPTISIIPPEDWSELDNALTALSNFQWLIFSSVNAVHYFFTRLTAQGKDSRALSPVRVCAVGPQTAAALASYGIRADITPEAYKAEGIVATFKNLDVSGQHILFPRANRAREVIPAGLEALGAEVLAPIAYRNVIPDALPLKVIKALEDGRIHCVTFTSSSTASNLADLLGENRLLRLLKGVAVAAIGPVTAKTCRELGLTVAIEPEEHTLFSLTLEIVKYFSLTK